MQNCNAYFPARHHEVAVRECNATVDPIACRPGTGKGASGHSCLRLSYSLNLPVNASRQTTSTGSPTAQSLLPARLLDYGHT